MVTDGDKFGQIEVPLSVESYDRNSLAISSIVICKRYHAVLPRAKQYTQLISKMYEYMPAAITLFLKQEPVIPFFQVKEPLVEKSGDVKVLFEMRVKDVKTGEVQKSTQEYGQRTPGFKSKIQFSPLRKELSSKSSRLVLTS